ncbi:MAG: hypothetical protein V4735_02820 [Pseudomonadota bacterium]
MTVGTLQFQRKIFKFFQLFAGYALVGLLTWLMMLCLRSSTGMPEPGALIMVGYPALVVAMIVGLCTLVVRRCDKQLSEMGLS